jgi:hypothetical protein
MLHLRECAEYVFAHRSLYNIFLKRALCLICRVPFVNKWRLSMHLPVSIELIAIYFHSIFSTSKLEKWRFVNQILLGVLSRQIIFTNQMLKKANNFWMILKH